MGEKYVGYGTYNGTKISNTWFDVCGQLSEISQDEDGYRILPYVIHISLVILSMSSRGICSKENVS